MTTNTIIPITIPAIAPPDTDSLFDNPVIVVADTSKINVKSIFRHYTMVSDYFVRGTYYSDCVSERRIKNVL